jgi:magnesium-transporting ATPase (P-type)
VVVLVREGRCALETSFVGFKFMILYPMIQLMMSATLNQFNVGISNNQFLFDDMAIVTVLALFSLYTGPSTKLIKARPVDTLFSREILISLIGQLFFCIFWFVINGLVTSQMPWFCSSADATRFLDGESYKPINAALGIANYPCYPIDPNQDTSLLMQIKSYENTSLWSFGHFQFVIVIFAINFRSHYRLAFWTNHYFTFYTIFISSILVLMLLFMSNSSTATLPGPDEYDSVITAAFNVQPGIPFGYRLIQLTFTLFHLGCAVVWEVYWDSRILYPFKGLKRSEFESLL